MTIAWERPPGVGLRLILIRHGEPEASAKGRCYGKLDVRLSETGRAQMTRVADALASTAVDAVYASPRRRARESARSSHMSGRGLSSRTRNKLAPSARTERDWRAARRFDLFVHRDERR